MDFRRWLSMSDDDAHVSDIAEMNLAAADGLPHAGRLDVSGLLHKLAAWVEFIKVRTDAAIKSRLRESHYADLSESQFRIALMITLLQRDLGVEYKRSFSEGQYDARDSRDLFLHGPLLGFGGTCSTMPVLYAAISRRLGYPLWLVFAKKHAFCRWDDGNGERFNIEATSPGFNSRPDEHYLTWPEHISYEEIATHGFLSNLSPREELAWFISLRGNCYLDNLLTAEALECYRQAQRLAPHRPGYLDQCLVATATHHLLNDFRTHQSNGIRPNDLRAPAAPGSPAHTIGAIATKDLRRILSNHIGCLTTTAP